MKASIHYEPLPPHGEIKGWLNTHARTQPVSLAWQNGIIKSITPLPEASPAPAEVLLAPLTDIQINGYAGVDFQQDQLTLDALERAAKGLQRAGCGRFMIALITDSWRSMLARLSHLRVLRAQSPRLRRMIVGWHIEGPFLSAEPGYHGAHPAETMTDPKREHVDELLSILEGDLALITLAPERPGSDEFIRYARSNGLKIALGHTNANAPCLQSAAEAGATSFTHLANGCPQQLDRHDNILWRALEQSSLSYGLIPDAIHLSPSLFRLLHHLIPRDRLYYTTDAMAAAGAPPGTYTLGKLALEVGEDRVVKQPGRDNFAGSSLEPINALNKASTMLGNSLQEVWPLMSQHPSQLIGAPPYLVPGAPAEFILAKSADPQSALIFHAVQA